MLNDELLIVFGILGVAVIIMLITFMSYYRTIVSIARFAYPVARTRAIGNPFIKKEKLFELATAKTVSEAISMIEKEGYHVDEKNVENSLNEYSINNMKKLAGVVPENSKAVFDAFLTKIEIEQIKKLIRMKYSNAGKEDIMKKILPVKKLDTALISELSDAKDVENLVSMLKETSFNDAFKTDVYELLILERSLDKYAYEKLRNAYLRIDTGIQVPVSVFAGRTADIINIKILLRARKMGYTTEETEKFLLGKGREIAEWKLHEIVSAASVSDIVSELEGTSYAKFLKEKLPEAEKAGIYVLENALDRYFLKIVSMLSSEHSLTIGPLLMFVVAKEYEIRNINAVIKGISEGLSSEKMESLLVYEEKT